MKKEHQTAIKWVCGVAAALLVVLVGGGWYLFGSFIKAAGGSRPDGRRQRGDPSAERQA